MLKKLQYYIHGWELKKKFTWLLCLSLSIVVAISLAGSFHVLRKYDRFLYEMNVALSSNIQNDIDSELNSISASTSSILANPGIQSSLTTLHDTSDKIVYNQARNSLYNTINYYLFSNRYIKSITMDYGKSTIHIGAVRNLTQSDIESFRIMAHEKNGMFFWTSSNTANGEIYCIREIREKAYISMRPLATLYISVDFDSLLRDTVAHHANQSQIVILTDEKVIAPSFIILDDTYKKLSEMTSSYLIETVKGQKKFITHGMLTSVPWIYLNLIDYHSIFKDIQSLKMLYFLLITVSTLVIIFFTNILVRQILARLQVLVRKMKFFEEGNLDQVHLQNTLEGPIDELSAINRTFDEMTVRFTQLINDNYVKQLFIKDAQMKLLQQQINPHFLYNTLDSINFMAQRYHADDISIMAQSLGTLFRGAISDTQDFISLKEEILFLDSYVQIQFIRFRDQLVFNMDIPTKYHSLTLPRMILQPLVENAIKHGLENTLDPCQINVSISEDDTSYLIHVANSGTYFESSLLEKLENQEITPTGTGIGLINIDRRLRLIYGNQYHMTFSNENRMAIATITLPRS